MVLSRATIGEWFVTGGFYVPDPKLQGQPVVVASNPRGPARDLGGTWPGLAGWRSVAVAAGRRGAAAADRAAALLMPLALFAVAALPF